MRTQWIGSVLVSAALAVGLAACGGDRSGTLVGGQTPAVTITAPCTPTVDGVTVTWSGLSTTSVRLSFVNLAKTATSTWVDVTTASSGSVLVALPAGVDTTWLSGTVSLASKRSGGGTVTTKDLGCASTVGVARNP
jgi:hypothetical protein